MSTGQNAFSSWNLYLSAYNINLTFTQTTNSSNADIIISMGAPSGAYGLTTHSLLNSTTYSKSYITLNDYQLYSQNQGGILSLTTIDIN